MTPAPYDPRFKLRLDTREPENMFGCHPNSLDIPVAVSVAVSLVLLALIYSL